MTTMTSTLPNHNYDAPLSIDVEILNFYWVFDPSYSNGGITGNFPINKMKPVSSILVDGNPDR